MRLHGERRVTAGQPLCGEQGGGRPGELSIHAPPKLDIVRVRPFNHIGPRQSPQFAVSSFARQLAAIERGRQSPILETGNLLPRRDLTDVRDVAAAYLLVMERGRMGEVYNIGAGQSYSMQTVLERLIVLSGVAVEVRLKTNLLRATDAPMSSPTSKAAARNGVVAAL